MSQVSKSNNAEAEECEQELFFFFCSALIGGYVIPSEQVTLPPKKISGGTPFHGNGHLGMTQKCEAELPFTRWLWQPV